MNNTDIYAELAKRWMLQLTEQNDRNDKEAQDFFKAVSAAVNTHLKECLNEITNESRRLTNQTIVFPYISLSAEDHNETKLRFDEFFPQLMAEVLPVVIKEATKRAIQPVLEKIKAVNWPEIEKGAADKQSRDRRGRTLYSTYEQAVKDILRENKILDGERELGRPTKYKGEEVADKVIAIMQSLSAQRVTDRKITVGEVAVAFYEPSRKFNEVSQSEKKRHTAKYRNLLKNKGLNHKQLLKKSEDKSNSSDY